MKKVITLLTGLFICINSAQAGLVIDIEAGWSGQISWDDGLGQIDGINGTNEIEWEFTLAQDSVLSLASAYDRFVIGDEFALVIDGVEQSWDNTFNDLDGYFHGESYDVFFAAGFHTMTINVTALAQNIISGSAFVEFSNFEPATDVPEPTTVAILGLALIGLGLRRRRNG